MLAQSFRYWFGFWAVLAVPSLAMAQPVTRADRWEGSVRECIANMKTLDAAADDKMPTHLVCACLATDLVNTCAPKNSTPQEKVAACIDKRKEHMDGLVKKCRTEMPLKF